MHARAAIDSQETPIERLSASIYGTVFAASVIAATADSSFGHVIVATLVTVFVFWLAEAYAHQLAVRLTVGSRPSESELRAFLRHRSAMVSASYAPLAVLAGAGIVGADVGAAADIALMFATGWLVLLGWIAAGRNNLYGLRRVGSAAVSGLFGVALVVLKFLLH